MRWVWLLCRAIGAFQQNAIVQGRELKNPLKLCQFFCQAHTQAHQWFSSKARQVTSLKNCREGPGNRPHTGLFPQPTLLSTQQEASKHTRMHPLQKYSFCISFACNSTYIPHTQPIKAFLAKMADLLFSCAFTPRQTSQADQSIRGWDMHTTCFCYVILC